MQQQSETPKPPQKPNIAPPCMLECGEQQECGVTQAEIDGVKIELEQKARERFGDITPCGRATEIGHCFTLYEGKLMLWFNTMDDTTRSVSARIPKCKAGSKS